MLVLVEFLPNLGIIQLFLKTDDSKLKTITIKETSITSKDNEAQAVSTTTWNGSKFPTILPATITSIDQYPNNEIYARFKADVNKWKANPNIPISYEHQILDIDTPTTLTFKCNFCKNVIMRKR